MRRTEKFDIRFWPDETLRGMNLIADRQQVRYKTPISKTGKTAHLAGFPKQPMTTSIKQMHRPMGDTHTIKLKQLIEIVLCSKPLCFDKILGKYPF